VKLQFVHIDGKSLLRIDVMLISTMLQITVIVLCIRNEVKHCSGHLRLFILWLVYDVFFTFYYIFSSWSISYPR